MRLFDPISETATFDATGKASILFPPVRNGAIRAIERIVLKTTSALATTCSIYAGERELPAALVDHSSDANVDVSVNNPPARVAGNLPLLVVFEGGTVGAKATCNLTQFIES